MKKNIKIKIKNKEQFEKIQTICFDNNIFWKYSGKYFQHLEIGNLEYKSIDIRDVISYGSSKDLEEVDADFFIRTNGSCVEDVYNDSPFFTFKKLVEINCEYLIFVEGKSKPKKIHSSLEEAEKEARRLCAKEMKEVHILKSVKKFKSSVIVEEV